MWNYNYSTSDELAHTGRKGMKWYQHVFTDAKKAFARKPAKDPSEMSTEELSKANTRAKLEEVYRKSNTQDKSPGEKTLEGIGKGADYAKGINTKRAKASADAKKRAEMAKMSTEEIRAKVNRWNAENDYLRLAPDDISKGRITADKVLSTIGTVATTGAALASFGYTIYDMTKKIKGKE